MKRPFVYISIPVVLGIVFYYFIDISLSLILYLMVLNIFINLIYYKKNTTTGLGIIFLFFLLGIFLAYNKFHSSELLKYTGKSLQLEGIVEEIKYTKDSKVRVLVRVKNIKDRNINESLSEKLMLTIIGNKKIDIYDTITFNAEIREPTPNTNPKLYNYKLNLISNGIFATANIRDRDLLEIKKDSAGFLAKLKIGAINRIERVFDKYLSVSNSSLMKSIVLGDYTYLEEDEVNEFRELGIAHVIAVSGLHIGLISSLIIGTLSFIGVKRKTNVLIALSIIWIYGFIIGMPASVLRANITFSLLFISQIFAKPYDSINTLFFALMILILINPFWCFNLGFQLSFITTFFIIYLTPKLRKVFNDKGSISGTLAAQIGILPILAYYFNSLSVIAIVANIVLVPLFTLSLVLSIFLILFSNISIYVSNSIGMVINSILNLESLMADIFYSFPFLSLRVPSPDMAEIAGYYIILFLIINGNCLKKLHMGIVKTVFFFSLFSIIFNLAYMYFDTSIGVEFIDVGQGDSILLRSGKGNYLIDTGGNAFGDYNVGKNIVLPYLVKHGIFNLHGVFITHFHEDHAKSLPYLIDNINIERIYIGYTKKGDLLYENIISKAYEKEIPVYVLEKGDYIRLGEDTYIYVLGPGKELVNTYKHEDNNLSLCLLLRHFHKKVLFTGDIEEIGEKNLIETLKGDIDFIKVPHHGSNTSSSEELLRKANPKVGFISVGRNNIYGHPHEEILERYEVLDIDIYRTDESGLINLVLDDDYFHIDTFVKEKWSIYTILANYRVYILIGIIYLIIEFLMVKYFLSVAKELERIEL